MGKGQLWHCWEDRITKDYSVRDGNEVRCQCGNLIGIAEGKWINNSGDNSGDRIIPGTQYLIFQNSL